MTTAVTDNIDLFQNAIEITKDAISNNDLDLLKSCLIRLCELKAPSEVLHEALEDCSLALLKQSGFKLQIFSGVLQKEISFGSALSWEEVQLIVNNGLSGEYLRSVLTAKEIFVPGAFIEFVEPVNTEDNGEDLLTTAA